MALCFAHRGFSDRYPENTLTAFDRAIEAGADGIELDVQLSSDGEVVIIHDESLQRTAGVKELVSNLPLQELKRLNVGNGFSIPESIPTLKEYLSLVRSTEIVTNIELKTGINPYPGIEEKVLEELKAYGDLSRIILSSFNHYSILRCQALCPEIRTGLLMECRIVDAASYARSCGADYLHPMYPAVTPSYVREAKENGIGINTWTVPNTAAAVKLLDLGVDGLIGNDPLMLLEAMGRR